MKRNWHIIPGEVFEFNSEDTMEHKWGDFVIHYGKNLYVQIDGMGNYIEFPAETRKLTDYHVSYFHRDEHGKIDHLWTPKYYKEGRNKCPICNPDEYFEF